MISAPFIDPASRRSYVLVSVYSPSKDIITAGAFSPEILARETLAASYPTDNEAAIYLLDSAGQVLSHFTWNYLIVICKRCHTNIAFDLQNSSLFS